MTPQMDFASELTPELESVDLLMKQLIEGHFDSDVVGELCTYHLGTGGRRLRARLALALAKSLGADPKSAIGWATACELLHNATLIHDDIQDGDEYRRGQPAVWKKYGLGQAINAGDLMLMIPLQAFLQSDLSESVKCQLALAFSRGAEKVVRGQAAEQSLIGTFLSSDLEARYLNVVDGKTSALFGLPAEGAALIAAKGNKEVQLIADMVGKVGSIFQICDDLLDFHGRKGRGKACEDLREGKVSSLAVRWQLENPKQQDLYEFLKKPRNEVTDVEIARWKSEFEKHKTAQKTFAWAKKLSEQVLSEIETLRQPELQATLKKLMASVFSQLD